MNARLTAEHKAFRRSLMWVWLALSPPFIWIVLLNAFYVAARLATGEWPGPWNHPAPTPFLGLCFRGLSYAFMVIPILMSILPGVAWLRHARASEANGSSSAVIAAQLSTLVWAWLAGLGAFWLFLLMDPLGAFSWYVD